MALRDWSLKRLLATWGLGLVAEAVLLAGALALGSHLIVSPGAQQARKSYEVLSTRWKLGDAADSISRAAQIASARESGTYKVQPTGDTVFAVVGVPSGRPDRTAVSGRITFVNGTAAIASALVFLGIPLSLVLVTITWLIGRKPARLD
jgi:hypothetical protein